MMGTRQKLKMGDEFDVICARKWYCYLKRAGVTANIKKRMRRRVRREVVDEERD